MIVKLEATLDNIYKGGDFRDKETGETKEGKTYLQLMVDDKLSNGQTKKQLINMPIAPERAKQFEASIGQQVELKCNISAYESKIYYEAV
ncbi:MAG: hypothetical protein AB7D29_01630 [Campylobacterales bacterium]